ncbi:HTH-type transcriptional activator RhaS [Pseudomonas extremaustralis]|uniref:AraC family transcriptional regulator n=1 Tax=Pseudomonas extremaustralis TaxID=359110 RepID=UPI002AA0C34B|nr:AraC family transcriptional regulator [Pseudomonas extremaustralis]MDY7066502.1 HTH-type transcriptional activator RhaS [Pseudomonas extremaustralis]
MPTVITPKELLEWVPGVVLSASDELGWKDIQQRSYRYKGQDVLIPALDHFMIVYYFFGCTPMDRCVDEGWTRTACAPGDISLLTMSQDSHWNWTEDIDVSHLYLSNALMSRVAMDVMERPIEEVRLHDLLRTQDSILASIVGAITNEVGNRAMGGALYVEALSLQLAIHLLRHYASVTFKESSAPGRLSQQQKKYVLEFIDSHLEDSIRLDEMADAVGLGVWTFARKFSESFDCSPHTFVTERRIERAKRMLYNGTLSIKEIAYHCGFSDQAHLTRVLRTKLGVTPTQLRRIKTSG